MKLALEIKSVSRNFQYWQAGHMFDRGSEVEPIIIYIYMLVAKPIPKTDRSFTEPVLGSEIVKKMATSDSQQQALQYLGCALNLLF